jgi:hypothetical protein
MPGWERVGKGAAMAAGIAVVLGGGYVAVRWLTPDPVTILVQAPSPEESWNETIARLGIDPVYPPEEDLVVGDLLAKVVSDEPDANETRNNKIDASSPILRRAVKIAHVDVREELSKAYAMLTVFPPAVAPPVPGAQPALSVQPAPGAQPGLKPGEDAAPAPRPGSRVFTADLVKSELPRAAFPSLKIQGSNSAGFGASAGGRGGANFGASNRGAEEIQLNDVRTYGLPSARAMEALYAYCNADKTKNDCLESTARKHLERVVGARIYNKYVDENGVDRYGVTIEVAMVNRVYLTSSIVSVRRTGSSQAGGLRAAKAAADDAAPQPTPGARPGEERADVDELKKRLAEVEAQMSKVSPGGVLAFESASGSEIVLKETFDRPIAIGIRTIRYDFSEQTQAKTAAAQ